MKKNGLLTFLFACIPGAGQMYYGYMKRGLSLISIFCIGLGLAYIIGPLLIICPIVWMYSFFDTYDLIRHITHGDPKPDSLLLFENLASLNQLIPSGNRLIGWVLVALGIWALYSSVLEPLIGEISWYIANLIPTLVVAVLLIVGGIWLLRGPRGGAGGGHTPFFGGGEDYYPDDLSDFSGMPEDETLGTGPAPSWPRAGVQGRTARTDSDPQDGEDAADSAAR